MGGNVKVEEMENGLIIFVRRKEIEDISFEEVEDIENYFRTLFLQLEEFHHISLDGFYNIHVYLDPTEGMVLKLEKEEMEFCPFHQLEMRIVKENVKFLYEVEDIFDFLNPNYDIYSYQHHFYIQKKTKKEEYLLYELGKIIYEDTDKILKNGLLLTGE